jgi:small subunit ribosomal protein S15
MSVTKEEIAGIVEKFGVNAQDTGKTEVQVALLTKRITDLTEHLKTHKKDHSSRRGLLKLVGQRRRFLKYLKGKNIDAYRQLISSLNLRK